MECRRKQTERDGQALRVCSHCKHEAHTCVYQDRIHNQVEEMKQVSGEPTTGCHPPPTNANVVERPSTEPELQLSTKKRRLGSILDDSRFLMPQNNATNYDSGYAIPNFSMHSETISMPGAVGSASFRAWTSHDDDRLCQLRTQGMNWGPIASNFPRITPNACRKRHERLMEKKNAESWNDGIKIEDLSRAYLEVREDMWKIPADALGEKSQTFETKVRSLLVQALARAARCMEKGLKTLITAGRAARRNDLAKQLTPPRSNSVSERSASESLGLVSANSISLVPAYTTSTSISSWDTLYPSRPSPPSLNSRPQTYPPTSATYLPQTYSPYPSELLSSEDSVGMYDKAKQVERSEKQGRTSAHTLAHSFMFTGA